MLFVATDEAGYGPKLGPLVITAVTGHAENVPVDHTHEAIADVFRPLSDPVPIGTQSVRIDDSKSVYKSGTGLKVLHGVVSASHRWCGHSCTGVLQALQHVAPEDLSCIQQSPWLGCVDNQPLNLQYEVGPAIAQWRSGGFQLQEIRARIITANRFNQTCKGGLNKADLLTESTLGLVRNAVASHHHPQPVRVYCDRHGGRRYYAGAITHCFDGAAVQVVRETKTESIYRLDWNSRSITIAFTVKGDRFPPVALASMHAKYWRERMMDSLNAYFHAEHQGDSPLKPTAGYPVDADRFLRDIQPILQRTGIPNDHLVRSR